jgi:hypothetical protein
MNIFVVNKDPVLAAQDLCDKHVIKMVLETAQLLCSAHLKGHAPYNPTHIKHPCTIWTAASLDNYRWLCEHGIALSNEYTRRYHKNHKSSDVIWWCSVHPPVMIPKNVGLTSFAQAMPDQYKNIDPVIAYRKYYIAEKSRFAKWSNRVTPIWFELKDPHYGMTVAV